MAWQITFEGEVYREGDLTLGQIERIDAVTGERWAGHINHPGTSPVLFAAVVAVMHADRKGEPYEKVLDQVQAMTFDQFSAAYEREAGDDLPSEYEDGLPQPAEGPSTPSS